MNQKTQNKKNFNEGGTRLYIKAMFGTDCSQFVGVELDAQCSVHPCRCLVIISKLILSFVNGFL